MSGLLALLDDVAAIAKLAAASVDDVAAQAAKAGAKAAGAVIDDAAVTPKYVAGLPAARELPIVGKIALGSIRNKLLILLPAALGLSAFAPWAIPPILMAGGAYLCFEGAEKVAHALRPHGPADHAADAPPQSAEHLETARVAGAVKTDFILSAEIMTIALATLPQQSIPMQALVLALVAVAITALVYGSVALIVKADDLGLLMAGGRLAATRAIGRGVVRAMPGLLRALSVVGTAAMLWVGGSIVLHGAEELGLAAPAHWVADVAALAAAAVPAKTAAALNWAVTAGLDGLFGLALGLVLVLVVERLLGPVMARTKGR